MKEFFGQVLKVENSTFTLADANMYHALNSFHSHQEMELIYVKSGEGTFSIGDTSKRISGDTMILIGPNVPHMFKFETNRYYDYAMKHAKPPVPLQLLTLHFDPNKLGHDFLTLPENRILKNLLIEAKKGLLIDKGLKMIVVDYLLKIETSLYYERLPLLLQLLNKIGESEEILNLSDYKDTNLFKKIDETRLTMIYLFTMDNFYKEIKLKEIAAIVHMVPNAFCYYFKSRTGRTYFDFLIAVRIEHACKLLRENNESITSVCNESGFSNLSNFNRYFKLQTGKSPLEYRRTFRH
ncbi:AraC family transcriptional regulator [Pedobacter sp.]|jgi:AraC-like DNA-binding protein|uniref:AraC family transcriptional regulator n=1 Tax=Pedobacter sp. TaxID=1411316 RepID=UPI002BA8F449|nr:AraC family transcriptional regulator [Pedobacter sp.]HWW40259.1 AraC family transcriptional regulator [Pedobacter sp.]